MSEITGRISIVGTPIGNLGDISDRAKGAFEDADVVYCEDTRVSGKLLRALGIEGVPVERLDENLLSKGDAKKAVDDASSGRHVVYCSDAGMPCISDPGQRLVEAAYDAGVPMEVVPGPTAVSTALAVSGIQAPSYYFGGFMPRKPAARESLLKGLSSLEAALVFYESPNRIASTMRSIADVFPNRDVAVCRELTKIHEEVRRGKASDVAMEFASGTMEKGEFAIVIGLPTVQEKEASQSEKLCLASDVAHKLAHEGVSGKTIADILQSVCGISRNDAYEIAHSQPDDLE